MLKDSINNMLGIMAMMVALLMTQCTPSTQASYPPPSWQGITPGQTNSETVAAILGKPHEIKSGTDSTRWLYPNYLGNLNDPIVVAIDEKCDCVKRIRVVTKRDTVLADVLQQYGEPEAVMGTNYWMRSGNFIYAQQGLAFTAKAEMDPEEATVLQIYYFYPTTIDELLETSWAANWPREAPYRWRDYQYKP